MRQKLVAGNWKMHGSLVQNKVLLDALVTGLKTVRNVACAVCVPYPYLFQARIILQESNIAWGAQNLSPFHHGAYTGEVSGPMLKDFGCRYVIVGHSERRMLQGEDNSMVAQKFKAAQTAGLIPILCIGETLAQREAGATEKVVAEQLEAVLQLAGIAAMTNAVVAYEPVWAIGTGNNATPEQAQMVHAFIRQGIAARNPEAARQLLILYGGSVKAGNAEQLFAMPDIDGGLIGGASLNADEFLGICAAAGS
ncbi:MAG TPA: triose-phosphate isomerase [Burkholderiales bacterium]|nr:triose-phosphate isomerase [Burkholderiales bacterium]